MTESERHLEALIDLERARVLERELRLESETLLSGLNTLSKSESPQQMFSELIKVLSSVFKFEDAFILVKADNNYMSVVASSNEHFFNHEWLPGKLFQRVIAGEPIAIFNVLHVKEWQSLPELLLSDTRSALHVPLSNQNQSAMLVCIHSEAHYFGPKQVKIARRFAPLISQAYLNIELKRSVTERDRLFTMSLDMMGIISFDGKFKQLNSAWEKTLGYTTAELYKTQLITFVVPQDRRKLFSVFRNLDKGSINDDFEICCFTKNNEVKCLLCNIGICNIEKLCYVVARDITTQKVIQKKLAYEADHDTLTGLANRKFILNKISTVIQRSLENKNSRFAVLFLDLDRFKIVNDSLGHLLGDELLIEISARIRKVIFSKNTVARLGGDEFLILLENIQELNEAVEIAELVQNELKLPIKLNGFNIVCTTSIGITSSFLDYQNPVDILRDADIAMYLAKAQGGASYSVFDSKMHTKAVSQLKLETDLRSGLSKNELQIFYQPIFNLENKDIEGFEALLRWNHKEKGLLSAQQFIPIAEKSDLISILGQWTIEKVCHDIFNWQQQTKLKETFYVSVNLSAKQLWQKDLLEQVKNIVNAHNLSPSFLKFEITENMIIDNSRNAISILQRIKDYGINLYIDDFGTGYSSLSYLHRFPFDVLKIDRSFVSRMELDQSSLDLVRTINLLAKSLGLEVIAEGIETQKQLDLLVDMNCRYGQGFLFSSPIAAKEIITLLKNSSKNEGLPNIVAL